MNNNKQHNQNRHKKQHKDKPQKPIYNLTPGTINGYKLNDGRDILFTGEMTPEGPSISIQQTSVFNDIVANKAKINSIRISAEQLGTDTSKMSDAQVLDFYLKLLIVKDIENRNEQQQTTQPEQAQETAQGQTTETTGVYIKTHLTKRLYRDWETDRKSTRLNSSHSAKSRMPSSA